MTQREPVNGYLVDGELERKHNLLTMSFSEVEDRLDEPGQDVVLVPLGSTEKHGAHIPLGTDSLRDDGGRQARRRERRRHVLAARARSATRRTTWAATSRAPGP